MTLAAGRSLASETPSKFNFGTIPFGKPIEEVLGTVEGASVSEDDHADFSDVGAYEGVTSRHFPDGIYTTGGIGCDKRLNSNVVKKYDVCYSGWDNIASISLYFCRRYNTDDPYTLFMVEKTLKELDGPFRSSFKSLAKTITGQMNVDPDTRETSYQTFQMLALGTSPDPAIYGVWRSEGQKVILLVRPGYIPETTDPPTILYISVSGCRTYLAACKDYDDSKQQEQEGKAGKAGGDF